MRNLRSQFAFTALLAVAPCFAPAQTPAPAAASAPITRDLGEGLAYFRAHELPADLPPSSAPLTPLVLDLRFASAKDSAATALDAWLKFRATPTTPVFVLLNTSTATALRDLLLRNKSHPGLLTLSPTATDLATDIRIDATADEDKTAYDALEHGTPLPSLLVENVDKPRSDEAALIKDRANPPVDPTSPAADPSDPAAELAENSPAPPPPPIDYTLQRAVHVHRALLALKRLP